MKEKKIFSFLLIFLSILAALITIEIFLIFKSKFVIDYDTEMWKYSKLLKDKSDNPKINHVHKKNSKAILQNVEIKTNSMGLRNSEEDLSEWKTSQKKILLIGSSVTLGWGVENKNTISERLNFFSKKDNLSWKFMNGGVGNYNAERTVNNFFENLSILGPDIIIYQYFLNDSENLDNYSGNFLTKNFHLGIILWKFYKLTFDKISFENIYDYYENTYKNENFKKTKKNLENLKNYCEKNKKTCYIVYTPDIQFIDEKKFDKFSNIIENTSKLYSFKFLDLSPFLRKKNKKDLINKYHDNHPNSMAHEIMAREIYNLIR